MIHYSSFASHKKMYGPTDCGCSQMSTVRTEDEPPDHYTKESFLQMEYVVTRLDTNVLRNCPIHKCVNELSIALI